MLKAFAHDPGTVVAQACNAPGRTFHWSHPVAALKGSPEPQTQVTILGGTVMHPAGICSCCPHCYCCHCYCYYCKDTIGDGDDLDDVDDDDDDDDGNDEKRSKV